MTPNEVRELFQQYLREIEDRPSDKTIQTYLTNMDGQVSKWAKQIGIVKETVYEKYLPEDVKSLKENLIKKVDLKKNNNSYHAPLTWYIRFCDSYSEYESINNNSISSITEKNQPILDIEFIIEGGKKVVITTIAERDSRLRKMAIKIHGLVCVCGFDFKKKYGKMGEGFIEIHHINQLRSAEEFIPVNTDPITDLIPLCSNCHRIVHRKKNTVLSINQLKEILKENAINV